MRRQRPTLVARSRTGSEHGRDALRQGGADIRRGAWLGPSYRTSGAGGGGESRSGDLCEESLTGIAQELDPSGVRTAYLQADISMPSSCQALVDTARGRFGRLDALVHVAANDSVFGGLMDGSLDDLAAVMGVNVRGTLELTRAAVPLLRERATSSVVMVGSTASVQQGLSAGNLAYGASKGALVRSASPRLRTRSARHPGQHCLPRMEVGTSTRTVHACRGRAGRRRTQRDRRVGEL